MSQKRPIYQMFIIMAELYTSVLSNVTTELCNRVAELYNISSE